MPDYSSAVCASPHNLFWRKHNPVKGKVLLKPSQWAIDRIAEYRNLKRKKFLLPFEIRSKGKPVIKRMKYRACTLRGGA